MSYTCVTGHPVPISCSVDNPIQPSWCYRPNPISPPDATDPIPYSPPDATDTIPNSPPDATDPTPPPSDAQKMKCNSCCCSSDEILEKYGNIRQRVNSGEGLLKLYATSYDICEDL